jgi:DNA adenine methylase
MRYLGGKARIAKKLSATINKIISDTGAAHYYEPFVGSGWILYEILCEHRNASDAHPDLILLWRALQEGWTPPSVVSRQEYAALVSEVSSALRGFVGFGCSFGGKWFGGYAEEQGRNYASNAKNSLMNKLPGMRYVSFRHCSFAEVSPIPGSVVYCDPPYFGTTGYKGTSFDRGLFAAWLADVRKTCTVLISEYSIDDLGLPYETVLSLPTKTDMHTKSGQQARVERLFRLL